MNVYPLTEAWHRAYQQVLDEPCFCAMSTIGQRVPREHVTEAELRIELDDRSALHLCRECASALAEGITSAVEMIDADDRSRWKAEP